MKKRKKRRSVSLGSVFMLLLTAAVLVACAAFFAMIAGDGLYEKTGALIRSLSERGLFEEAPQDEVTPAATVAAAAAMYAAEETAAPTAPPATPRPEPEPVTFTIAAAGTVYAPKAVRESAQSAGGRYDFTPVFEGLGDTLSGADLAIATLETTTAGKDKGFGNYNTAPEILDGLRGCGVDLLSLGTERALDKGYEGLDLTVSELTARGLNYAGVHPEGASGGATMLSIGGAQVAVLAYAYGLSDESTKKTGGDQQGVLAMLDVNAMIRDITQARVSGANLVIVLPHWGTKNKAETADTVRRMARLLAEAGADVILGTHPNVAQDTERLTVTRSDGLEHEALVCYSLGSLLTDARTKENTAGMVAHVTATYDPATRRTTLGEMYCTPVYIARQREEGDTVYRVVDAENSRQLELLEESERQAAQAAVEHIRSVTAAGEQEGQG